MQPNQTPNQFSPGNDDNHSENPYAFLDQTGPTQSSSFSFLTNGSFKAKLIFGAGSIVVVVFLLIIIKLILSGSSSFNLPSLNVVLYDQQVLIDLTNSYSQQSSNQISQSASYTILGTLTTDENTLTKLLTYNNQKVNVSLYSIPGNITSQISQSVQINNFDQTYQSILISQLTSYSRTLQQAYVLNKSPVIKSYLNTDFNHAKMLYQMLNSSQI